ncbi:MAG: DinB family protein [Pyrinomonadaceae bacterium]
MTLREFYLQRQEAELPTFMKVLKALPKDRLDYKPHERSPSAEQIVWTLTCELQACLDVVNEGKAEWKVIPPPPYEEMLEKFESWSKELMARVSQMDESAWDQTAKFYYQGKVVSEQPVGTFLWFILFDAIHHRGQLTTYLRPMGSKVPAIYGPSADEAS